MSVAYYRLTWLSCFSAGSLDCVALLLVTLVVLLLCQSRWLCCSSAHFLGCITPLLIVFATLLFCRSIYCVAPRPINLVVLLRCRSRWFCCSSAHFLGCIAPLLIVFATLLFCRSICCVAPRPINLVVSLCRSQWWRRFSSIKGKTTWNIVNTNPSLERFLLSHLIIIPTIFVLLMPFVLQSVLLLSHTRGSSPDINSCFSPNIRSCATIHVFPLSVLVFSSLRYSMSF